MISFAFLFDVDGVLTLPITQDRKISVIDPEVIKILHQLHNQGFQFSLITGRAFPWVQTFLLRDYGNFLKNVPIFMEYGLTSFIDNKFVVSKKAKDFRDDFFFPILSSIKQICQDESIRFDMSHYVDYPQHGSLWLEEKNGMISIAFNKNVSPDEVQRIVKLATQDYNDDIRILNHHLGCDILPTGWSKEQAALESYRILDPLKNFDNWFVFGDNEADREMCKPFSNVSFIDTKIGASETTIKNLQEILNKSALL